MKLYWGNDDLLELVGEYETKEEVFKAMNDFLRGLQFESYYQRWCCHPDGTVKIDYGSWRNFFYIKEHGYGNDLCAWH